MRSPTSGEAAIRRQDRISAKTLLARRRHHARPNRFAIDTTLLRLSPAHVSPVLGASSSPERHAIDPTGSFCIICYVPVHLPFSDRRLPPLPFSPYSLPITRQTLSSFSVRWMPLDEFISTQDHPLILQVCDRVLGLRSGAASAGAAP